MHSQHTYICRKSFFHHSLNLKSVFFRVLSIHLSIFLIWSSFKSSRYEPDFPLRKNLKRDVWFINDKFSSILTDSKNWNGKINIINWDEKKQRWIYNTKSSSNTVMCFCGVIVLAYVNGVSCRFFPECSSILIISSSRSKDLFFFIFSNDVNSVSSFNCGSV